MFKIIGIFKMTRCNNDKPQNKQYSSCQAMPSKIDVKVHAVSYKKKT